MAAPNVVGTFTDAESLLILLRQRQEDLGLSNEALENVCGFTNGVVDKYLGPSRVKVPTATTLAMLMDGLGLSGQLVVDADKTARISKLWRREGRRADHNAHPPDRLSKVALRKARPLVLGELARQAAAARWGRASPETRAAHIHRMNAARLAKRLAGKMAQAIHGG